MENVIQFADYEVLQDRRELRRAGAQVELGGRAYDMLMVFLTHRGTTLTKDRLLKLVWPESVVEDSNVYTQISALRAALDPQILATIPGRGYRFLAPVEILPGPAASMDAHRRSTSTRLFGRSSHASVLRQMLAQHRLTTVTGAGGTGKSSLIRAHVESLDATAHWGWADLSTVTQAQDIAPLIAQALRIAIGETPPTWPALSGAVSAMTALLVLDGAEHLAVSIAEFAQQILRDAPGITLCVTSQVSLKLDAERLLRLEGLALPAADAPMEDALACGSVELFADQVQSVLSSFRLDASNIGQVTQVVRALDGVPLLIKLAADRLPVLGLSGLLDRMDEQLRLLTSSRPYNPPHQQSVRAALQWSYSLVGTHPQSVLNRIAVFPGVFTPQLAHAVTGDLVATEWELMDVLALLVDHSLVMTDQTEPPGYRLLASTRDFSRGKLEQCGQLQLARQLLAKAIG